MMRKLLIQFSFAAVFLIVLGILLCFTASAQHRNTQQKTCPVLSGICPGPAPGTARAGIADCGGQQFFWHIVHHVHE